MASARGAILHAIDDHAAASLGQVGQTSGNILVKQDIESLATELQRLTLNHAQITGSVISSMATKDDIQDLKVLLRSQSYSPSANQTFSSVPQDTSRMMLVLAIPQLGLPIKEAVSIMQHFSTELRVVLKVFLASFVVCLKDLLLALPQLILLYKVLRRLPQAISLVLHDNITFEDALGRMQSLQFQQFRHWTVFEASLRCKFDNLPGMRKVLSGQYVLTSPRYRLQLTPDNWSEVIRPGFVVKMAIMIDMVLANHQRCPRQCESKVSQVTDLEYRCDACAMVFAVQLKPPAFGFKRRNIEMIQTPALEISSDIAVPKRADESVSPSTYPKATPDATNSNDGQPLARKDIFRKRRTRIKIGAPISRISSLLLTTEHKGNERQ